MVNIVFVVIALIACWAAQIQGDADLEAAWAEYQVMGKWMRIINAIAYNIIVIVM